MLTDTAAIPDDKSNPKERQPLKTSDKYDYEDADIELISSDNVLFKVHSYQLQCVSPVFRSMIAMANSTSQRDPIHLTHPTIDQSQVVTMALDIIYTLNIPDYMAEKSMNLTKYVIDFARKWEITRIVDLIQNSMRRELDSSDPNPLAPSHFLVALHLGDNDLAVEYLHHAWKGGWLPLGNIEGNSVHAGDHGDDKPNHAGQQKSTELPEHYLSEEPSKTLRQRFTPASNDCGFDFGRMSYLEFLGFPPTVVWTFLRAEAALKEEGEERNKEDILLELLNIAYPPSKSTDVH